MQEKKSGKIDCPCLSGKKYQNCCQILHLGEITTKADILMRSRYSAFALDLKPYILKSWHSSTRPESLEESTAKWFYLKITSVEIPNDDGEQFVTFEARFREENQVGKLKERSRFIMEEDRLVYIDGEIL